MQQDDYLMRQIEQMTQVLKALIGKLLGLKSENREEEIKKSTHEMLKEQLNTSIDELLTIPLEEITEFIVQKTGLVESNVELLAEILVLNARANTDNSEKISLFEMALELYHWSDIKSATFSLERQKHIQEIEDQLK